MSLTPVKVDFRTVRTASGGSVVVSGPLPTHTEPSMGAIKDIEKYIKDRMVSLTDDEKHSVFGEIEGHVWCLKRMMEEDYSERTGEPLEENCICCHRAIEKLERKS